MSQVGYPAPGEMVGPFRVERQLGLHAAVGDHDQPSPGLGEPPDGARHIPVVDDDDHDVVRVVGE